MSDQYEERAMTPQESLQYHRNGIAEQLLRDEELRFGYQSNIAMLLHDQYGVTDYKERNQAAIDILNLIFDIKCKPVKYPL